MKSLGFHSCPTISDETAQVICDTMPQLQRLYLIRAQSISYRSLYIIASGLKLLKVLSLCGTVVDFSACGDISTCMSVTELLLMNCQLDDVSLSFIAKNFPNLETLFIGNNRFTWRGVKYLMNAKTLVDLDIGL
eukprot:TRINITY_DN9947_c0_g1_i1.p1 TRINITY_DN9947_c0_g1~~TRINITY_DN9947_c0_g1_i1.p1  ORF type:complete len:134 (-),score=13.84 TRINITY_DN9947_c0_g1_i1:221-622(-)